MATLKLTELKGASFALKGRWREKLELYQGSDGKLYTTIGFSAHSVAEVRRTSWEDHFFAFGSRFYFGTIRVKAGSRRHGS